jgi:putative globular PEP-CTERM protein (TIGR04254 family)
MKTASMTSMPASRASRRAGLPKHIASTLLAASAFLAFALVLAPRAAAQSDNTVTLVGSDGGGYTTWDSGTSWNGTDFNPNNPAYWSDGLAPHADADYLIDSTTSIMRSPNKVEVSTFGGDSLTLRNNPAVGPTSGGTYNNGGPLALKSNGGSTLTINNLRLESYGDQAMIKHDEKTGDITLAGNITLVTGTSRLFLVSANTATLNLIINSNINGTGALWLDSQGVATASYFALGGNNSYTGYTRLTGAITFRLDSDNALGNTSGVIFTDTFNSNLDLNGHNANLGALSGTWAASRITNRIAGTTGTATITVASGTTLYAGILNNAPGVLAVAKAGSGTLVLTGINNTWSGDTTISGGLLLVQGIAGNNASSSVNIHSGGALAGTGTVAGIVHVQNGGALHVAASSTLTIGSGTLADGATLGARFLADGAHGTLVVSGALDIAEGAILQLAIDGEPTTAVAPGEYKLVSAAAGITGSFAAPAADALGAAFVTTLETYDEGREIWVKVVDPTTIPLGSAPAVSDNSAGNVTHNGFTATWGAVFGATGYQIEISTSLTFETNGIVTGFEDLITVTGGDTLSHAIVTGLAPDMQYYYRVRATNAAGEGASSGPWSEPVPFITVGAPSEELVSVDWFWDTDTNIPGALASAGYIATHWAGPDANDLTLYAVSPMIHTSDDGDGLDRWDIASATVPSVPGAPWVSVTRVFQYKPGVFYGTAETISETDDVDIETLDLADLAFFWELIQDTNVSRVEVRGDVDVEEQGGWTDATENYPATAALTGTPGLIPQINGITLSGELPTVYDTTSAEITVAGGNGNGIYTLTSSDSTVATVNETDTSATTGIFTVTINSGTGTYTLTYGREGDGTYSYVTAVSDEITVDKAGQASLDITGTPPTDYNDSATITVIGGSGTGAYTLDSSDPAVATVTPIVDGTNNTFTVKVVSSTGSYKLIYKRAGNDNYNVIEKTTDDIPVNKANQAPLTITSSNDPLTYAPNLTYTIVSSGGSGDIVGHEVEYEIVEGNAVGSIDNTTSTLTIVQAGTIKFKAIILGNGYYEDVESNVFTLTVNKATQTAPEITSETTHAFGTPYTIESTTGGPGTGAITYAIIDSESTGTGEISGPTLNISKIGTFKLTATKDEDVNYTAATSINEFILTVGKGTQDALTLSTPPNVYSDGAAVTVKVGGGSDGTYWLQSNDAVATVGNTDTGAIDGNFTVTLNASTGSYTLTYGRTESENYNAASDTYGPITIIVIEAAAAATLANPVINSDANTITLDATDGGVGNYYALYASEDLLGVDADSWTFVTGATGQLDAEGAAKITFEKIAVPARFYRLVTSATPLNGSTLNADAKYSTNVAGHYAVTILAGAKRIVALQLDCGKNRIDELFAALPPKSLVSRSDPGAGKMSAAMKGTLGKWANGDLTLDNGAAALVKNGSTTEDVTLEFAGLVNTDAKTHTFAAGEQLLLTAPYPVTATTFASLGYIPVAGDTFNHLTDDGAYVATVITTMGEWPEEGTPPVLNLAEGFFLRKADGDEWTLPALDLAEDNFMIILPATD